MPQTGRPGSPSTDLVDLVEQHDGVHRTGLADRTDDAPGQCADIGAPVPADLGLVANATEGDAHELATEGRRNGLTERRLTNTGRADERQHGTGATSTDDGQTAVGATGTHGEVLGDAVLDVVEAVVVSIEHGARRRGVGVVGRADVPWQLEHGV